MQNSDSRLIFQRLPRPCRPSPRRFLPEARGRARRCPWPEISNNTLRTKISYVSRRRGCIEGCWRRDQVYHRWGGSSEAPISNSAKSSQAPSLSFSWDTLISTLPFFLCVLNDQNRGGAFPRLAYACTDIRRSTTLWLRRRWLFLLDSLCTNRRLAFFACSDSV